MRQPPDECRFLHAKLNANLELARATANTFDVWSTPPVSFSVGVGQAAVADVHAHQDRGATTRRREPQINT